MSQSSPTRRRLVRLLVAGAIGIGLGLGLGAAFTSDAMAGWSWYFG